MNTNRRELAELLYLVHTSPVEETEERRKMFANALYGLKTYPVPPAEAARLTLLLRDAPSEDARLRCCQMHISRLLDGTPAKDRAAARRALLNTSAPTQAVRSALPIYDSYPSPTFGAVFWLCIFPLGFFMFLVNLCTSCSPPAPPPPSPASLHIEKTNSRSDVHSAPAPYMCSYGVTANQEGGRA